MTRLAVTIPHPEDIGMTLAIGATERWRDTSGGIALKLSNDATTWSVYCNEEHAGEMPTRDLAVLLWILLSPLGNAGDYLGVLDAEPVAP